MLALDEFAVPFPYACRAESYKLKIGMRQNSVKHRRGRYHSGEGGIGARVASGRPGDGGRSVAAGRSRRRPLLFYAATASVAGELAAIAVDVEALVLLFSLIGLFLCAVILWAARG